MDFQILESYIKIQILQKLKKIKYWLIINRLHQNCYQTFGVNHIDKIWREFFDLHIDLLGFANEKRKYVC